MPFHKNKTCFHSHVTLACNDHSKDILELKKKLSEMEKEIKENKKEPVDVLGKDIERKLHVFEKDIEKKMEAFQHQIKNLNIVIAEKNSEISALGERLEEKESFIERLKVLENKFEQVNFAEIDNKITDLDTKVETAEIFFKASNFKCNDCDYSSISEQSLKSHIQKKHKEASNEKIIMFPVKCDLCEKDLKT